MRYASLEDILNEKLNVSTFNEDIERFIVQEAYRILGLSDVVVTVSLRYAILTTSGGVTLERFCIDNNTTVSNFIERTEKLDSERPNFVNVIRYFEKCGIKLTVGSQIINKNSSNNQLFIDSQSCTSVSSNTLIMLALECRKDSDLLDYVNRLYYGCLQMYRTPSKVVYKSEKYYIHKDIVYSISDKRFIEGDLKYRILSKLSLGGQK